MKNSIVKVTSVVFGLILILLFVGCNTGLTPHEYEQGETTTTAPTTTIATTTLPPTTTIPPTTTVPPTTTAPPETTTTAPPPADTNWQNSPGNRAVWVASQAGEVIHSSPYCSNMANPVLTTIEMALAREDGGRPCMICWTNRGEDVPPSADTDWQAAPGNRAVWVASQAGEVIHSSSHCSNMANPIETTIDTALAREGGGRPCMICWQNIGDPVPPVQTNDWLNSPGNRVVWVASQVGEVIHSSPYCSNMTNPIETTIDTALARESGGRPCMMCWANRGE